MKRFFFTVFLLGLCVFNVSCMARGGSFSGGRSYSGGSSAGYSRSMSSSVSRSYSAPSSSVSYGSGGRSSSFTSSPSSSSSSSYYNRSSSSYSAPSSTTVIHNYNSGSNYGSGHSVFWNSFAGSWLGSSLGYHTYVAPVYVNGVMQPGMQGQMAYDPSYQLVNILSVIVVLFFFLIIIIFIGKCFI